MAASVEELLQEQSAHQFSKTPLPAQPYGLDRSTRKLLGSFYTPQSVADFMADWVVRVSGERILEPSFGDGSFLRAAGESASRRNVRDVRLVGIEIDEPPLRSAIANGLIASENAHLGDFLSVQPFCVHAVLGNPPYVRLRQLSPDQRQQALELATQELGEPMDPAGSLWLPFLLHAMRFLELGGRMAFVLPYELTYVRYARPLWRKLGSSFGSIRLIRVHERPFPEILQDVVILLADNFGTNTSDVHFEAYEGIGDLVNGRPVVDEVLSIGAVVRGKRAFLSALLSGELRELLENSLAKRTIPVNQLVRFNIGYVAGDKDFFHPNSEAVDKFAIPRGSLFPSVTSARAVRGGGLRTASLGPDRRSELFMPHPDRLSEGEKSYVSIGEARGVSMRYKCRIRKPWYVVPGVRVPDLLLSVFSERPILLINDDMLFASNSLLCGYSLGSSSRDIAAAWYSSLTLLSLEMEVHSLGGGVMVVIPGEVGRLRLPKHVSANSSHLNRIDLALQKGDVSSAYRMGDDPILVQQAGLTPRDVEVIREGIEVLTHWRTSARTRKQ